MPLINRNSNSYDGTGGFAEGIRNLGEILAQGPAIRARAAYMRQEGARADAQGYEAAAHGNLYQSQANQTDVTTAGLKQIGDLANQGLLRTDKEGNLVVDSSLASKLVGGILQQATGASDAGGGLQKALAGMNAPVQADLNRQSKMDVTEAVDDTKENIAEKTVAERLAAAQAGNQTKLDVADKTIAGRLAAAAVRPPGSGMQPYEQTEVRQIKNPAFVAGQTNTPPTIDVTNRISRVVGNLAKPQAQPSSTASAGSPGNQPKSNLITIPDDVSADVAGAIQRGNDAIGKGADPAAVKARLKQLYGYDL